MATKNSVFDHIMDRNREDWGESFSLNPFPERVACVENGEPDFLAQLQAAQRANDLRYYKELMEEEASLHIFLVYVCGYLAKASGSGGVPLERSSAIAGHYLSKFPFVDSIEGFVDTTNELMQVFAQEVHRHKSYHTGHQAVDACLAYIYEHIDQPISLDDLSRACGYSSSRLQHLFPQYTGRSISDYIRQEKISKAKFLLTHTDLSCAAVGQKLSFCNQSYFIKTFKKAAGMTPAQYKASSKQINLP